VLIEKRHETADLVFLPDITSLTHDTYNINTEHSQLLIRTFRLDRIPKDAGKGMEDNLIETPLTEFRVFEQPIEARAVTIDGSSCLYTFTDDSPTKIPAVIIELFSQVLEGERLVDPDTTGPHQIEYRANWTAGRFLWKVHFLSFF
jgi:hypothetical protein